MTRDFEKAALDYLRWGWSVIPLRSQGKRPLLDAWEPYQHRLPTEEEVVAWWQGCPEANIGVVCGAISGLFVVDADGPDAERTLSRSGLPPTPTVETSPGKRHYYFRHPGLPVPNAVRIASGLDIRGDGGYVVAPPSLHPSGSTYEWLPFLSPDDVDLAVPPDWLVKLIHKQKVSKPLTGEPSWVVLLLRGVSEGERDDSAIRLVGHWLGKGLSPDEVKNLLLLWNQQNRPPMGELKGDPPAGKWVEEKLRSAVAMETRKKGGEAFPVEEELKAKPSPLMPQFPDTVWRGLFPPYRDLVGGTTEAPDSFHFVVLALVIGATLGRRVWVHYANPIYPNFYICKVGSTSLVRKGTAWRRGQYLLRALHSSEDEDSPFQIVPGIGSAEGLLDSLNGERKVVVVAEEEFRSLLTKARQEALANLIPKLTVLFDCPQVETLQTRQKRVIAKEPFLSIITGTTPTWLEKSLAESDIHGGFANRFLYVVGEPKEPMPFPPPIDKAKAQSLIERINAIRLWAEEMSRSETKGEVRASQEATEFFAGYYRENYERAKSETLDGVLIRRATVYAWKFALLYAAMDKSSEITKAHIEPAIEACRFFEASVERVFSNFGETRTAQLEKKTIGLLKETPSGLPQRTVYTRLHIGCQECDALLRGMEKMGLIERFQRSGQRGPSATYLKLAR